MEKNTAHPHLREQDAAQQNRKGDGEVQDSRVRLQGNKNSHSTASTIQGVNDAKTLVNKYLNKEAVYGELLSKIADNEKSIEQLKNETEALIQESKQLEMDKEVLQSVKIKTQDLHGNNALMQTTSKICKPLTTGPSRQKHIRTKWDCGSQDNSKNSATIERVRNNPKILLLWCPTSKNCYNFCPQKWRPMLQCR